MKLLSRTTKIASLAAVAISVASLAHASVISVNFYNSARGTDAAYMVQSAAGVANVGNWNNFDGPGGINGAGVHNGLLNDSGVATGTYINYVSGNDLSVWGLGVSSSQISSGNSGIFNNFLNYYANGGITYIGGLGTEFTSGGYNVIVYFADMDFGWQSYSLTTSLGTQTLYGRTQGGGTYSTSPFGGFVQSTATTAQDATNSNYVMFTGLTSDNFSITGSAESGARPAIAGFQIVAVPEPGTMALAIFALGGLFLVVRRRRVEA